MFKMLLHNFRVNGLILIKDNDNKFSFFLLPSKLRHFIFKMKQYLLTSPEFSCSRGRNNRLNGYLKYILASFIFLSENLSKRSLRQMVFQFLFIYLFIFINYNQIYLTSKYEYFLLLIFLKVLVSYKKNILSINVCNVIFMFKYEYLLTKRQYSQLQKKGKKTNFV